MPKRFPNVKFEDNPARLAHPILACLKAYWDEKRGTRPMPARADLRPADIREHLPWIVLIDVLHNGAGFRYRLIGTLITQYFKTDATGQTVDEAWASQGEEGVQGVLSILRRVTQRKIGMRCYGETGWNTIGLENFDSVYLPLSDDGETVNMILHAFVFNRPEVLFARKMERDGDDLLALSR
jgi:hypothetical protein